MHMTPEDRAGHPMLYPWEMELNPGFYRAHTYADASFSRLRVLRTDSHCTHCANKDACIMRDEREYGHSQERRGRKKHLDAALFACDGCFSSRGGAIQLLCFGCASASMEVTKGKTSEVLCELCLQARALSIEKATPPRQPRSSRDSHKECRRNLVGTSFVWNFVKFLEHSQIGFDPDTCMGGLVPKLLAAGPPSPGRGWALPNLLNEKELEAMFFPAAKMLLGSRGDVKLMQGTHTAGHCYDKGAAFFRIPCNLDCTLTRMQVLTDVETSRLNGQYLPPLDDVAPAIFIQMEPHHPLEYQQRPTYLDAIVSSGSLQSLPQEIFNLFGYRTFGGERSASIDAKREAQELQQRRQQPEAPYDAGNMEAFFHDVWYLHDSDGEDNEGAALYTAGLATDFGHGNEEEEEEEMLLVQEEYLSLPMDIVLRVQEETSKLPAPCKGPISLGGGQQGVQYKVFVAPADGKKYIKRTETFGLDVGIRYFAAEDGREVDILSVDEPQDDEDEEDIHLECPFDFSLSRKLFASFEADAPAASW